jgi:hypothetical protein
MYCRECGESIDHPVCAYFRKDGSMVPKGVCRPCHTRMDHIRRELEKQHPRPPAGTPCACCGRIGTLVLDHSHTTGEFRGYICGDRCNLGIAKLGDNIEGVAKALAYLLNVESPASRPG